MKITQSGFHDISNTHTVEIASNIEGCLYFQGDKNIDISIGESTKIQIFLFLKALNQKNVQKIKISQSHKNSKVQIRAILVSEGNQKLNTQISSIIEQDGNQSDVKILSIAGESGDISLDGIVEIKKGISHIKARLEENNLFLGSTGKIQGIPTLLVASQDVEASHSCKMERISDEKLFYLRSRGIEKENALYMILDSYVKNIFHHLGGHKDDLLNTIVFDLFSRIK